MAGMRDPNWEQEDKFEASCKAVKKTLFISEVSVGMSGSRKIVHYDGHKLLRWGALLTMFCKGTIFSIDMNFYIVMAGYFLWCVAGCAILSILRLTGQFEVMVEGQGFETCSEIRAALNNSDFNCPENKFVAGFDTLSSHMQPLTMFIFGLFTSLSIGRWWSLRIDSLGFVMDAIVYITGFLSGNLVRTSHLSPEEVKHMEQDIIKCMKLSIASLAALTQKSRGESNMSKLVKVDLITEQEAELLDLCPSAGFVLWSWIGSLGDQILTTLKVPPPNRNPFWAEVQGASNSITRLEANHDSQLPFPYVHVIVMLVNINNISIAFRDGLHISQAYLAEAWMKLALLAVHLLLVPTMYQALLMICFMIEDPLGDDITDFPIVAFQSRIYSESKRVVKATREFWELRRKMGLLGEPAAASPAPAAPAPPPARAPPPALSGEALEKRVREEVAKRLEPEVMKQKVALQKRIEEIKMQAEEVAARVNAPELDLQVM